MGQNLYHKVFDRHCVGQLPSGQYQLFIGLHLIHEVTSPQAFAMIREQGLSVPFPERTFATVDHIIPTTGSGRQRPLQDPLAEEMLQHIEQNTADYGINFFSPEKGEQGVVHVVGPERGLTQPGMTIACGDSHTSTHGAFGTLAFGIGTSQVADALATQTLAMAKLKVRRINFSGSLKPGVYAKDVALAYIHHLGVNGGVGYAYEFGGDIIDHMTMEERMTVCNMSIEAGAKAGLVAPDEKTFAYLEGREYAPKGQDWEDAVAYWKTLYTEEGATFDTVVELEAADIAPQVTWGTNPGQVIGVNTPVPAPEDFSDPIEKESAVKALEYMGLKPGEKLADVAVNHVFIGSCTNGRIEDMRAAAQIAKRGKVADSVTAIVVPGSGNVKRQAEAEGLDKIFIDAGFEWRLPGCSMCLGMNDDKLVAGDRCASTSNRNFEGRQGRGARTHLVSPAMAAAAAITGRFADVRDYQE